MNEAILLTFVIGLIVGMIFGLFVISSLKKQTSVQSPPPPPKKEKKRPKVPPGVTVNNDIKFWRSEKCKDYESGGPSQF
jgi:hypothetical protein